MITSKWYEWHELKWIVIDQKLLIIILEPLWRYFNVIITFYFAWDIKNIGLLIIKILLEKKSVNNFWYKFFTQNSNYDRFGNFVTKSSFISSFKFQFSKYRVYQISIFAKCY